MTSFKNREAFGMMAKTEAGYGTPATMAIATDGVVAADIPTYEPKFLYDGERFEQPAGLVRAQRLPKTGRYYEINGLVFEVKGPGAAMSASIQPQGLGAMALCKAAGWDLVLTTTPGSEKVELNPTPPSSAMSSTSIEFYEQGEKVPLCGCYGDLELNARDGGPGLFTWNGVGMLSAQPADAALPAIVYPQTNILAPNAAPLALVLGSYLTAVVKELSVKFGRTYNTMRPNLNAGTAPSVGIAGAMWGPFDPVIKFTIESSALVGTPYHTAAGLDPYRLEADSVNLGVSFQIGTTQYNRFKGTFANGMQFKSVKRSKNGSAAQWDIEATVPGISPTDMTWAKLTWD